RGIPRELALLAQQSGGLLAIGVPQLFDLRSGLAVAFGRQHQQAQQRLVARGTCVARGPLEPAVERPLALGRQGEDPSGSHRVAVGRVRVDRDFRDESPAGEGLQRLIDLPGVQPPDRPETLIEPLLELVSVIGLLAKQSEQRILDHFALASAGWNGRCAGTPGTRAIFHTWSRNGVASGRTAS